jgi:hypothetical protein
MPVYILDCVYRPAHGTIAVRIGWRRIMRLNKLITGKEIWAGPLDYHASRGQLATGANIQRKAAAFVHF